MRTTGAKIYLSMAEYAIANKIQKPYSLYLSTKAKYSHSIIYNFNYNKLAKTFHVDPKTAKRYIRKLIDHKFCEIHHNNLVFRSQQKVMVDNDLYTEYNNKKYYGEYLKLKVPAVTSINQIYTKLFEYILSNNLLQQEYNNVIMSGKFGEHFKLGSRTKDKAIYKHLKRITDAKGKVLNKMLKNFRPAVSKEMTGEIIVTTRGMGRLWNVSHQKAKKIFDELVASKKLVLVPIVEKVMANVPSNISADALSALKESANGYYFWGSKTHSIYRYKGQMPIYKGDISNRRMNFVSGEKYDMSIESQFGIDPETRFKRNDMIKSKRNPIQRAIRKKYYRSNFKANSNSNLNSSKNFIFSCALSSSSINLTNNHSFLKVPVSNLSNDPKYRQIPFSHLLPFLPSPNQSIALHSVHRIGSL